ncbi:MAG: Ig-like domain-containing protein [Pseudolysinimonas sp.]
MLTSTRHGVRRSAVVAALLGLTMALLPLTSANAIPLPTGSVSGTFHDANGLVLVDAELSIHSASHSFDVFSTAGGVYSLSGIPAGTYEGYALPPSGSSGYGFVEISLVVGSGTVFNPVIPLRSDVAVTVTDGVNPVAGVIVAVVSAVTGLGSSNGPDGTLANGLFSTSIDPGDFVISVQPPDGSNYAYQFYSGATSYAAASHILSTATGAGSPFLRTVVLVANNDQITGHATISGSPATDGFIYIYNSAGENLGEFLIQPDGSFSTAGVPDGDYTIQAHFNNGEPNISQVQSITVSGSDVVSPDLVFVPDPGATVTGVADAYSIAQETLLTKGAPLGVLKNDSIVPASEMSVALLTAPTHGALFLQVDGGFSYAPADGFVGTDTFRYRPSGDGGSGSGVTVTITVTGALAATGQELSPFPLVLGLLTILVGTGAIILVRRRRTAS